MAGVGDGKAVDAFPSVGHKGFAPQNMGGKGVENPGMLFVFAVGFYLTEFQGEFLEAVGAGLGPLGGGFFGIPLEKLVVFGDELG